MVVLFKNEELEQIYESGEEVGKPRFGKEVIKAFIRKIDFIVAVENSVQLAKVRSLHLEELTKEKKVEQQYTNSEALYKSDFLLTVDILANAGLAEADNGSIRISEAFYDGVDYFENLALRR